MRKMGSDRIIRDVPIVTGKLNLNNCLFMGECYSCGGLLLELVIIDVQR